MSITTTDINISHYLIGFHAFRKDHNYASFKGNFINDISEYFDYLYFDQIDVGPVTLLKSPERTPIFEIKISADQLIYQDNIEFNDIVNVSKNLLNLWRKYSGLVTLKLSGIVYNFQINIKKEDTKDSFEHMLKHFEDLDNLQNISRIGFNLNYQLLKSGQNYRVNLSLNQNSDDGPIEGFIDFHKINDDAESGISEDEIDKVFIHSNEYFKNDFIKILNKE